MVKVHCKQYKYCIKKDFLNKQSAEPQGDVDEDSDLPHVGISANRATGDDLWRKQLRAGLAPPTRVALDFVEVDLNSGSKVDELDSVL